jgi:hypothetical protein
MGTEVDAVIEAMELRVERRIAQLDAVSTQQLKQESQDSPEVRDRRRANLLEAVGMPSDT